MSTIIIKPTNSRRSQVESLPKVNVFLNSIERNSNQTKRTYHTALVHFQDFLNQAQKNDTITVESIVQSLNKNEINIYELLDSFVSFEMSSRSLSVGSIRLHLAAIKSYLAYHDVDILPTKYKRRVRVPKLHREDEEALTVEDIRKILLSCNNRRLKAYLLVLASGGMRAVEGLAIRLKDIDFSVSPTKIHIRKEYAKTRVARNIYISDEATHFLKQLIAWKYRPNRRPIARKRDVDDLVFAVFHLRGSPGTLYSKVNSEFSKLLEIAKYGERKEGMQRRKITLHSFRRFVKTTISDQVGQDYSDWFLGHAKSSYYTKKEPDRREIYSTKCMKYLTFLDYATFEATGKNIEAKLQEKDSEIQAMKMKYEQDMKAMREEMNQQFNQIMSMIQQNPTLAQVKPEILTKRAT